MSTHAGRLKVLASNALVHAGGANDERLHEGGELDQEITRYRTGDMSYFPIIISFGWSTVRSGICLKSSFSSKVKMSLMLLFFMMTL